MNIQYIPSPNYTPGRIQPITKIVIHWAVGTMASTDAQFANPNSEVSAHYCIEDNNIHQYVKNGDTAWHARQANPYSLGVEHSAAPGRPATEATINTSAQLVAQLCSKHNIAINRGNIIPHSQVVATECPGTIPIDRIISMAQAIVGQEIKEEDMKIPDNDAWFNRFNKLTVQIRNRQITREEFRKNFVGADAFRMVEVLSDHPEADRATALQKPTDAENKLIKIREIVK